MCPYFFFRANPLKPRLVSLDNRNFQRSSLHLFDFCFQLTLLFFLVFLLVDYNLFLFALFELTLPNYKARLDYNYYQGKSARPRICLLAPGWYVQDTVIVQRWLDRISNHMLHASMRVVCVFNDWVYCYCGNAVSFFLVGANSWYIPGEDSVKTLFFLFFLKLLSDARSRDISFHTGLLTSILTNEFRAYIYI